MSKSEALRVQDVRDAYRLIVECRDLGNEPALWHRHMLEGLSRLFGVTQATGGEGWWPRPGRSVQPISAYDVSADTSAHHAFLAYHRAKGLATDPIYQALEKVPGQVVTRTRRQLVSDAAWYRSVSFNEYRRPARIDHEMTSVCRVSDDGAISGIALIRTIGERDFLPREQRLLNFFHAELGRLIRGPLVSATKCHRAGRRAALTPTAPDAGVPAGGRQREAGCRATRPEPRHCPSVCDGSLSSFRCPEPRPASRSYHQACSPATV